MKDLIDWASIEDLKSDVGDDAFPEIVDLFLAETGQKIAALEPGPALEDQLHSLKGGLLSLGFRATAMHCDAGERQAADGAPVDLDAIRASYSESRDRFLAAQQG